MFALRLSQMAQIIDMRAITPNGTPTPAPIATSLFPLDDPFDVGVAVVVGKTVLFDVPVVLLVVTFASAARPIIISESSSWKGDEPSGQAVLVPFAMGVPQQ